MILRSCIIRCLWLCFLILPTSVQAGIIGAGCISEFYRRLDRGTQMNASSLAAIEAENMAIAYGTAIIMIYLMFMTFVILTIWIFSSLSLLLNSRIAAIIGVGTVACHTLVFGWWHSLFLFEENPLFSELRVIMALYANVWVLTACVALAITRCVFKRRTNRRFESHLSAGGDIWVPNESGL